MNRELDINKLIPSNDSYSYEHCQNEKQLLKILLKSSFLGAVKEKSVDR